MGFNYTRDESFQMGANSRERKLDDIERRLAVVEKKLASNVVEVVRCKDCEHWTNDDCPFSWGKVEDAFCSYGERREK